MSREEGEEPAEEEETAEGVEGGYDLLLCYEANEIEDANTNEKVYH